MAGTYNSEFDLELDPDVSCLSIHDNSLSYAIYSVFAKCAVACFITGQLWYLFTDCHTFNEVVENINISMFNLLCVYRYWHMTKNIDIFLEITKSTESKDFDVKTSERKQLLNKWAKINDRYIKLLLCLVHCTLVIWYIEPFFEKTDYKLMVNMHLPYDYKTPVLYPITYFLVMVWFTYTGYFIMANDMVMQTHLIHIIFQFLILGNCFENIMDDCAVIGMHNQLISGGNHLDRVSTRFNSLVDQHNRLFNLTKQLQKVISIPMLGQLVASLMLICFAGFELTKALNSNIVVILTGLMYLSYNLFQLFIFCRWCDEITVQSLNIRDSVYACQWEKIPLLSLRGQLRLVIARASIPLILKAGGIWDLSLATYSEILKKSYSGVTLLLQVQKIRS